MLRNNNVKLYLDCNNKKNPSIATGINEKKETITTMISEALCENL